MVTVLTAGHVNWDVTLRVDRLPQPDGEASIRSQFQSGGGSAANVAVALAGLGVRPVLVGSVGDDDNGRLARRELEDADVSLEGLTVVEDAPTAVKYLLVDDAGEVSILGNDGVNEAVRPADVDPNWIRHADHVHLTSQRPKTASYIASVANEAGVPVSFDPGRRLGDRDYTETLVRADIVFATDHEAEAILESEYAAGADDRLVVVTAGADGAVLHTPDGRTTHPGFDVEPVDSSGAGDAFAAGFIATSLNEGLDPNPNPNPNCENEGERAYHRALEFANACGALAASRKGPRSMSTTADVRAFLERRS
ncbi:carbohydrate kinase family protein [Halobacteria archaeon AArc-m2/3/4]|uniref:Carbohydrate kinase family protein n=1 Tax=Natronoglomus mannanivorans TaxID=2979990 RepID=A0ABT2QC81_9EURY|nr:carbohydrate kinase family protein [Halobacteria archaeon AArc-m2/3/4]